MTDIVNKLLREDLKALKPYESARRLFAMADASEVETAWLNANENPFVPEFEVNGNLFNRYPDFQPEPLIRGYANYAGLEESQVLATRGADEGIELLIRTFCNLGDSILINPPTYGMYEISAQTNSVNCIKVPTLEGFALDTAAILENLDKVKLVFICSPNNPTGQVIKRQDIVSVLEAAKDKALVVADEAYIEFCADATVTDLLAEYPNLVILRTLSKAFGLAGLRCGFTLANAPVIDALKKVIAPYPVPAPVAQIASQALSETGINWMQQQVTELNQLKAEFVQQAQNWSFIEEVFPSDTNFVLFRLNQQYDTQQVMAFFIENNVLLRDQSKQLQLDKCLRLSIGNQQQMQKVFDLFNQLEK